MKIKSRKGTGMKRILVVDDAPDILEIVQLILEDEGYQVQTSLNGACFQQMEDNPPHLILLDILLSGEDGREICQQLKSSEQTKHIPVILISAHTEVSKAAEVAGANNYLAKPFRMAKLVEMVKQYLPADTV